MKDTETMGTLDTAIQAIHAGLSIVPILPATSAGDKRPAIKWRHGYTALTEHDATTWFTSDAHGLAIIMGHPSRDLLMIELEGRAASELGELSALAKEAGIIDLWQKLFAWCENSPSGGWHFYLHAPGNTSGNRKLARNTHGDVIAETRENGGYSVVAPTTGRFHHSGKPWRIVQGNPTTAATVTLDELDTLLALFRTLDHTPHTPTPQPSISKHSEYDGLTPGDDFEARTSWNEILEPAGWHIAAIHGSETFWTRPGKPAGISASTGHADDRDRLYVFSTSTLFEAEKPYTKFAAYALLNHDGDYHAAAKTLAAQGYGTPAEHPIPTPAERSLDRYINQLTNHADSELHPSTPRGITTPTSSDEPTVYTRTDDGNALRFAHTYQGQLMWIPEKRSWAAWNGHQWDLNNGNLAAREAAKHIARTLPDNDKLDQRHKKCSLAKTGIDNMLYFAQSMSGMHNNYAEFDTDPWKLNTPAGLIDLRTGTLQAPNSAALCLRSTTIAPANMPIPHWNNFLAQTFSGEEDIIPFLQRLFGLAIIGQAQEQILPFFHGVGANGKTTMLNIIQRILGKGDTGYTTTITADLFLAAAGTQHPTGIASLMGTRIAVASELEEGQRFAEARVKLLTGRDELAARFMHGDFFTFHPTHTFFLLGNHEPQVKTGGSAFWRRLIKIAFLNVVPEDQRDPDLEDTLMAEAPGILQWVIEGTQDYCKQGLNKPESVTAATAAYEREQDTVVMFVDEMCMLGSPNQQGFSIYVSELRSAYEHWCMGLGLQEVSARSLTQRLQALGVVPTRHHNGRSYDGIRLRQDGDRQTSLNDALGGTK